MSAFTESPVDKEQIVPREAAEQLRTAFEDYYEERKNEIERKKLDAVALKNRANITDSSVPNVASNIVGALYSSS